jgi:hypothetical protein
MQRDLFSRFLNVIFAFGILGGGAWAQTCPATHQIAAGDSLPELASFYFGDRDFASAILIATNSRTGEGFGFISDPNRLKAGGSVCIPEMAEAFRLHSQYATYLRATAAMVSTEPWEVSPKLVTIAAGNPLDVVTWVRADQVAGYKHVAPQDVWVTVEPHLREFCRDFLKAHDGDLRALTLRLEQRLGLPPAVGKTTILRLRLESVSGKTIFRPCADPATERGHCEAGGPSEKDDLEFAGWFYRQFYYSYGLPRPSPYPWTALGYTFDWAQKADGEFERFGESEFVIPKGARIEVLGSVGTGDYCR